MTLKVVRVRFPLLVHVQCEFESECVFFQYSHSNSHLFFNLFFMFDFEKLTVYQKAKEFNKIASAICLDKTIDKVTTNQLKRAALSIPLNIAEGTPFQQSR